MANLKGIFSTICFTIIFLQFYGEVKCQNHFIETNYHYGFLWQHRPSLADIAGGNIHAFQIEIGQNTYGKSFWDQLYRYPDRGFGISHYYLGNPKDLGKANSLYFFLRIPLIKNKRFSLNYKISGGLAYLDQENIAIGTHLNLYFNVRIDAKLKIGEKVDLINAFGATHLSNGAIKMPNLGVNLFSYTIGLIYKYQDQSAVNIINEVPVISGKNIISATISAGTKEKRPDGNIRYSVASASIEYLNQLSYKHKIGTGFDFFYDESLYELMNPDSSLQIKRKDILRYGWHLAFEAQIYRLVLGINLGTYLYAKYTGDGKIYQRIALKYAVSKNLFANISLKTSKGVADFVELGIGYHFHFSNFYSSKLRKSPHDRR